MILRHVTLKRRLSSIINSNELDANYFAIRKHSQDGRYNAFEINPASDVLLRIFPIIKSNCIESFNEDDIFELIFDGDRIISDGLILEDLNRSKYQLRFLADQNVITFEELQSIGDFRFTKDKVSLDYLTSDSKRKLEDFINQNKE